MRNEGEKYHKYGARRRENRRKIFQRRLKGENERMMLLKGRGKYSKEE